MMIPIVVLSPIVVPTVHVPRSGESRRAWETWTHGKAKSPTTTINTQYPEYSIIIYYTAALFISEDTVVLVL